MHATKFLDSPAEQKLGPVVVVYGKERFLKVESIKAVTAAVLGADSDGLGLVRLPGESDLKTVLDSLRTVSMWNPRQLVLVEDADEFVSEFRQKLEAYLEAPSKKSVLLLDVQSWPANTRLAKKVASSGLPLECSELKGAELADWVVKACRARHGKKIDRRAAQLVVDLAGTELGIIDQELAKLAAFVGQAPSIDAASVEKLVGGWRLETTWKMLDAVRDGRMDSVFDCLEKLFAAGEHPVKLLGGINFVYRPLARATELSRQGQRLEEALVSGGAKFNIPALATYLKRIQRTRAEQILRWLLDADLAIKGSKVPERLAVERLLVQLAGKT